MGGGGSLDAMNKSLKANRGLLKKISAFENIRNYGPLTKKYYYTYKKASKEELERIRRKTIIQQRIALIKTAILITLFSILGIIGLSFLF